jgi:hypothetical protein
VRFHEVRELYARSRDEIFIRVEDDSKQAALQKDLRHKGSKHTPPITDPARRQTESWMLLRLLSFASLQNTRGMVHLLTALEYLIGALGKYADRQFMFIFGRSAATVVDSDTVSLNDFIKQIRKDERHRLRARPLNAGELRGLYDFKHKDLTVESPRHLDRAHVDPGPWQL